MISVPSRQRGRRAFGLMELLIASAVATLILACAWTFLSQYTRAYGRRDENMERARKLQATYDAFRLDVHQAARGLGLDSIPKEGLKAIGFPGDAKDLLTRPRFGVNIINAYHHATDQHPYLSKRYPYREIWVPDRDDKGNEIVRREGDLCRYLGEQPPQHIWDPVEKKGIGPAGPSSVIHVTQPPDGNEVHFLVLDHPDGVVFWAYRSQPWDKVPGPSLSRWSPRTGLTVFSAGDLDRFELFVDSDWAYWDKEPPRRPGPWIANPKFMVGLSVGFRQLRKPGDPTEVETIRVVNSPPTT